MKRITTNNLELRKCLECKEQKECYEKGWCFAVRRAIIELMRYEKTGLPPSYIQELKKRDMAKPPIDIEDNYGFFVCPSCGNSIYASDDFESHKFCLNCGQRILWKEDIDGK